MPVLFDQEPRVRHALRAAGCGVVAQPGQLVQDERRPDHHRGLPGEVGGPRGVDVLCARHGVVADEVVVEGEGGHARGAVERDPAAVVHHLAAVGQRQVLEGLLGEGVAGDGGPDEPGDVVRVQLRRRGGDVRVGARLGKPRGGEQVAAVEQQLRPRLAGHRELRVPVAGELERPCREGLGPQRGQRLPGGGGVEKLVRGQRADRGQRQRADDVRQDPRRGRGGDQLGELVLVDTHHLDGDARGLREPLGHRPDGGQPLRQVLQRPDHEVVRVARRRGAARGEDRERCQHGRQRAGGAWRHRPLPPKCDRRLDVDPDSFER